MKKRDRNIYILLTVLAVAAGLGWYYRALINYRPGPRPVIRHDGKAQQVGEKK